MPRGEATGTLGPVEAIVGLPASCPGPETEFCVDGWGTWAWELAIAGACVAVGVEICAAGNVSEGACAGVCG